MPFIVIAPLLIWAIPVTLAGAQTAFDAPPNVSGAWTAPRGVVQFNLLHRFSLGPTPGRKLLNSPTLSFAYGLHRAFSAGVNYASDSQVFGGRPNEFEIFGRTGLWRQTSGAPFDVFLQGGYNTAAKSFDGQALLARQVGDLRLVGGVAVLGDAFGEERTRFTLGAGATLRLVGMFGITGDLTTLSDAAEFEEVAWSAGLLFGVARTPHTLSLHASNVASRTLQGTALGSGRTRYGFEYTIPVTLARFGSVEKALAPPPPETASIPGRDTVRVAIHQMRFSQARVEVTAGTTIVWENRDPLAHTVTGDAATVHSEEILPGGSWATTFVSTGIFVYHCTPHPFMRATVVVTNGT